MLTEKQLKAATKGMPYEQSRVFERTEKHKRYDVLLSTAREVAAILGNQWTTREDAHEYEPSGVTLCCADGRGIHLSISHYSFDGKVNISGRYNFGPREYGIGMPYKLPRPDINVALTRGAKAIAGEITRRFMAEYDAVWNKLQETISTMRAYREKQTGIAERLAASIGAEMKGRDTSSDYSFFRLYDAGVYECRVSGGTVNLALHDMTEAQALAILKIATTK